MKTVLRILAFAAGLTLSFAHAHAQGTARSMDFETSVRAAGMAGASSGVWWGEPGNWGNPAALSQATGVRWVDGHTQLVPGLASDVFLDTRRLLVGGYGIGFAFMGAPFEGLGKLRLDYGASEGTDPFGNPTGSFNAFEEVEGWGLGLSPLRLFDAIRGHSNGARPFDVSLGVQHKHTVVALAPPAQFGAASGDTWDYGVTARLTLVSPSPETPLSLDVSSGFSMLNANDAQFVFISEDAASPPTRMRRVGLALHTAMRSWPSEGKGSIADRLFAGAPLVEGGIAFDTDRNSAGGNPPFYTVQHFGLEMTVLGVLTGRYGHYSDRTGQIVDDTFGYGLRLPLGPYAAIAYDHATVPQANGSGLPDVHRRAWSAWIDPVRILRPLFTP